MEVILERINDFSNDDEEKVCLCVCVAEVCGCKGGNWGGGTW